ncbi:hypothetical protein JCM14036_14420 [Desulfotomaculum defluvii]
MKKFISITLVLCLFFSITSPAFAKRGGSIGGGFSKPRTTNVSPSTSPSSPTKTVKDSDADTSKTTTNNTQSNTTDGDKIPYTNLNSSKKTTTSGATTGAIPGTSRLSGFRPSFSPFSGNFWFWMFLMNSFGHSQPAVAQTDQDQKAENTETAQQQDQSGIYTPGVGDYWAADPVANSVSTLILVLIIALPFILYRRWKKKRYSY